MDEEAKKEIAVFRFGVIADLVGRKLNRGEKERILKEKVSCQWDIPRSGRSYVSRSTILSWLRQYEGSGRRLESLYPDERADKGKARVLDEETVAALCALKKDRPGVSLPLLMKEAKQRGILSERRRVSYATVYRLFKRHGLTDEGTPVDPEAVRGGTAQRFVAVRLFARTEGTYRRQDEEDVSLRLH